LKISNHIYRDSCLFFRLVLPKKYGFAGLYVNTGIGLIRTVPNVDLITNLVKNWNQIENRSPVFIDK